MIKRRRLTTVTDINGPAERPGYDRALHGVGIVHLGPGAFHRAHQAAYTDAALASEGGDWCITGASLRSTTAANELNPQNGLYTLLERDTGGTTARVVGALKGVLAGPNAGAEILAQMEAPGTRIVSLTVTEKAYGIDRDSLCVAPDHPAVSADLMTPREPSGVLGLITEALRRRRTAGLTPFTVLCCDNLPDNGALLRGGVIDFARRVEPGLVRWIEDEVPFPSTMVDRITPAATDRTRADAIAFTGCSDLAAIETEPFSQWVIEDNFAASRPAWEAGGALFVSEVRPYELMKLRMLNGAHSALAYAGFIAGCTFVRDVMDRSDFAALVDRHMRSAQLTLPSLPAIDADSYRSELLARFGNKAIDHRTAQIAMDGTEKLPQRLLMPAVEALSKGDDISAYAFAVASWMRYCMGQGETGEAYELNDPHADDINAALDGATTAEGVSAALHALPRLFPAELRDDPSWRSAVAERLERMLRDGMAAAVAAEVS